MPRALRIVLAAPLALVACSSPSSPPTPTPVTPACMCTADGAVVTFPPDLPALPTFVESDTCVAVLARGGLSIVSEADEDCRVQVTLANGEVLTATVSFKPLPACCASKFVAEASPFVASNVGAPDAGSPDGSADAQFPEWWDPACGTPANACPETCAPVSVIAASAECGPYEGLMVGCAPRDQVTEGWGCVMRRSDGEIFFSETPPGDPASFEPCPPEIPAHSPGPPATCPDAAAP